MAVKKVDEIISEVVKRARQIETEDGKSFMELKELRKWAAALQDANNAGPDVVESRPPPFAKTFHQTG